MKVGDYATIKRDARHSMGVLNGLIFKVVATEYDEDRAIIMVCSKTRPNQEQENFIRRQFYYGMVSIYYMENDWYFNEDDFQGLFSLEDWLEDDEDNYEGDYTDCVEYETEEPGYIIYQDDLIIINKKGNSYLFWEGKL